MPDGMITQEQFEAITKEVKGFGDNIKKLGDSMQTDLAAVRKLAEEAKGAINPELKSQIDALTASVAAKHEAIEKQVKASVDRADELEKKLNRPLLAGTADIAAHRKASLDFHCGVLASRGELKVGMDLSEGKVDYEAIDGYSKAYPLYLRKGDAQTGGREHKTMMVGSNPDGGYFVSPAMSPRVLSIYYESSPMRELATIESIGTDAIEFPIDDGEADCGWVGETESRATTNTPQVGVQRIPVHEIYAKPKATQKLLEDASIDIEAWLGRKVGDKLGRTEATAFVSGDGVKRPRGFLTYATGTSRGQIEQIVSGAAAAVTADGLINLMIALKEPYAAGAIWLMRRATTGSVMLLKDGNGQYIWRPGLEAGKPSILLGHEVRQAADMPAVAANALAIAFGNFKQGYTIVDRLGISTLRDPFSAKPFVEFYTRKRVGGDVTNFEAIKILKIAAS